MTLSEQEYAQAWAVEREAAAQKVLITKTIIDTVAQIDIDIISRYPALIGLISQYLEKGNLVGATGLLGKLIEQIVAANDTEALAAAQPVIELLGG